VQFGIGPYPEGFQSLLSMEVSDSRAVSLPLFNLLIIVVLLARGGGGATMHSNQIRAQYFYQGSEMKKLLATFGLLCLALSADAATLHYSYPGSSTVIAIENLDIGGTL
jgi:hypothetical protein